MILPEEVSDSLAGLPGETLVRKGIADLVKGDETTESLLALIGAPRLRSLGINIPEQSNPDADYRLYDRLRQIHGIDAHARYNSLIRELISFERALEHRRSAR
jgi:hypothetical protein